MRSTDIHIVLMLPVFNRGLQTASFMNYFGKIISPYATYEVVVFDDGSTDNTIDLIQISCKNFKVICLPGDQYWGGSLNHIKSYVTEYCDPDNKKTVFLVANDDIEYIYPSGIVEAISMLDTQSIICAWGISRNYKSQYSLYDNGKLSEVKEQMYYDSEYGEFTQASSGNTLLHSTWSMLATREAWIAAPCIPSCIPHYLSDYWLILTLANYGFKVKSIQNFGVYFDSTSKQLSLKHQLRNLSKKNSYYYAPAHIKFMTRWSKRSFHIQLKIYYLKIFYLISKILGHIKGFFKGIDNQ